MAKSRFPSLCKLVYAQVSGDVHYLFRVSLTSYFYIQEYHPLKLKWVCLL